MTAGQRHGSRRCSLGGEVEEEAPHRADLAHDLMSLVHRDLMAAILLFSLQRWLLSDKGKATRVPRAECTQSTGA